MRKAKLTMPRIIVGFHGVTSIMNELQTECGTTV